MIGLSRQIPLHSASARCIASARSFTRLAFSYPDDDNSQKWQQHLLAQRAEAQDGKREAQLMPALITADKLNFSYKVTGATEQLRPVRVFDDGAKTYIQMRPEVPASGGSSAGRVGFGR